jgi:hypothetical protein
MKEIDQETTKLAGQGGRIKKDIDLRKYLEQVYRVHRSINSSSPNLDTSLDNIEGIWGNIKNEVNKVIKSSY